MCPDRRAADWVRNVLASGRATLIDNGTTYVVDQLSMQPTSELASLLPASELRTLQRFRVDHCLTMLAAVQP